MIVDSDFEGGWLVFDHGIGDAVHTRGGAFEGVKGR